MSIAVEGAATWRRTPGLTAQEADALPMKTEARGSSMLGLARVRAWLDSHEIVVAAWMERNGYRLLRIAMGIVFIWFDALKPLGLSPAEALVARATAWIPVPGFLDVSWIPEVCVCWAIKQVI
jgi:hypothetical protein